jgi:hypothetical protein
LRSGGDYRQHRRRIRFAALPDQNHRDCQLKPELLPQRTRRKIKLPNIEPPRSPSTPRNTKKSYSDPD